MIPNHPYRLGHLFPNIMGICTFVLVLFCGMVGYDTLVDDAGTITMGPGHAHAWNNGTGLVVEYERGFTVHRDGDAEVQRTVVCPKDGPEMYFLDSAPIRRYYEMGVYPPYKRPIQFAVPIPVGTSCKLQTWGVWRRQFAISSQRYLLDEIDFVVQKEYNGSR